MSTTSHCERAASPSRWDYRIVPGMPPLIVALMQPAGDHHTGSAGDHAEQPHVGIYSRRSTSARHCPMNEGAPVSICYRGSPTSNCQNLWFEIFQAASSPISPATCSSGRSTSKPFSNLAPARTRATRCGAFTARQRDCAASISL